MCGLTKSNGGPGRSRIGVRDDGKSRIRDLFLPHCVCKNTSDGGKNEKCPVGHFLFLVALVGLEPTLLAELDFESSASTSSATEPEHIQLHYFAADFFASTFLTNLALRFGL